MLQFRVPRKPGSGFAANTYGELETNPDIKIAIMDIIMIVFMTIIVYSSPLFEVRKTFV